MHSDRMRANTWPATWLRISTLDRAILRTQPVGTDFTKLNYSRKQQCRWKSLLTKRLHYLIGSDNVFVYFLIGTAFDRPKWTLLSHLLVYPVVTIAGRNGLDKLKSDWWWYQNTYFFIYLNKLEMKWKWKRAFCGLVHKLTALRNKLLEENVDNLMVIWTEACLSWPLKVVIAHIVLWTEYSYICNKRELVLKWSLRLWYYCPQR